MTEIDRSIALARTRDGRTVELFAWRIAIEGGRAWSLTCNVNATEFAREALTSWRKWAAALPAFRARHLVAEAGLVAEHGVASYFSVVHSCGAVLMLNGCGEPLPGDAYPIAWQRVPESAVILGPAAALSLIGFTLDSVLSEAWMEPWPFENALLIEDVTTSPYLPQSRLNVGAARRLMRGSTSPSVDYSAFMLLQRSEYWQRPITTLYNIQRHNLAIRHARQVPRPASALILDSLMPENEPTQHESIWLATWHIEASCGQHWGAEPIILRFSGDELLGQALGAAAPPAPACIPDPIEGDLFGTAPALLLRHRSSELQAVAVLS